MNRQSGVAFKLTKGTSMSKLKNITLYSQEGGSDKVYLLQMVQVNDGYGLVYANGRRGSALKTKPKTTSPLSLVDATKEFDKIVKSKINSASRYAPSLNGGETLELSEKANKDSGLRVKLLNEITEDEALILCNHPDWVMQPKFDGERRPIIIKDGSADGTNRNGQFTGGLKTTIANALDSTIDMILDTEDLGNFICTFDILEYNGKDLRSLPFIERYNRLTDVLMTNEMVRLSPLAVTTSEKIAMLDKVIKEGQEGVVFLLANAPYVAGKPANSANLKYKLYSEISVIVQKINTQRSVQMAVINNQGDEVIVGNVTIPANASIPEVGSIIDVRYLYAYEGGSLYQPIFEKPRNDIHKSECLQSRIKYKPTSH
jgi:bifunctional non-homologous end joining protein LigD